MVLFLEKFSSINQGSVIITQENFQELHNDQLFCFVFFFFIKEKVSLTVFFVALTSLQLFVWKDKQNLLLWPPAALSILFFET